MKTLCTAAAFVLLAGSAVHAGSIIDRFISGSGLSLGDCGFGSCGSISRSRHKSVAYQPTAVRSSAKRERNTAMAERATRTRTATAAHNDDRTQIVEQTEDLPAAGDEHAPLLAATAGRDIEQEVAVAAPEATPVASDADSPIGEWTVEGSGGRVQIRPCGQALCGIISAAKNPNVTDRNNADAGKRKRTVIGMPVLIDMKPADNERWEGQLYNANDGKTYAANIAMKNSNVLRVEGCVLGGSVCGSQDWTRAKAAPQG